jgi:hypothetical protein
MQYEMAEGCGRKHSFIAHLEVLSHYLSRGNEKHIKTPFE